jgi:cell division protein ZapA
MNINKATSIQVMGKDYHIACPENKIPELHAAVKLLNTTMQEIKSSSKSVDNEKIAVMAAINLANELLNLQDNALWQSSELQGKLTTLCNKVEKALEIA